MTVPAVVRVIGVLRVRSPVIFADTLPLPLMALLIIVLVASAKLRLAPLLNVTAPLPSVPVVPLLPICNVPPLTAVVVVPFVVPDKIAVSLPTFVIPKAPVILFGSSKLPAPVPPIVDAEAKVMFVAVPAAALLLVSAPVVPPDPAAP